MLRRLPLKVRLTAGFAAAMAILLVTAAVALRLVIAGVLLDDIDTGLRSRVATIEAALPGPLALASPTPGLVESHEAFAQVLGTDGQVLESSIGDSPLVDSRVAASRRGPTFFDRQIRGVAHGARLLVVTIERSGTRFVIIVGSSMSDRSDALHLLSVAFLVGLPLVLVVASAAGWMVAGRALRPVELMQLEAGLISVAGPEHRLTLPEPDDEIRRLGTTLNAMLERLDEAQRAERRFLDHASHELRTPLTALKAELDLARARPRSAAELAAALESASVETDRLARMADDLLLLSRVQAGRLTLRREPTRVDELLEASASLFAARASNLGIVISVDAPTAVVEVDPRRVRQAADDLVDNALRFARHSITLSARVYPQTHTVEITVDDDGPGFAPPVIDHAFEPFARTEATSRPHLDGGDGAGLGLSIVHAIAASHGGSAHAANRPGGGAQVVINLVDASLQDTSRADRQVAPGA
jgi:two-component system OmpR family sensor kinase